jgi:hypothetical protein
MVTSSRGTAPLLATLVVVSACLGRVEQAGTNRTLPFHVHQDELAGYRTAAVAPPSAVTVASAVRFEPFIAYYPLPIGLAVQPAAYNGTTRWAPIVIEPAPEHALQAWFERSLVGGSGAPRTVHAVVTDFQWYMLGVRANAGRIATQITVTDEHGAPLYQAVHVTEARVAFVDALFRAHVRDWLADAKLVAALNGGGR